MTEKEATLQIARDLRRIAHDLPNKRPAGKLITILCVAWICGVVWAYRGQIFQLFGF